LIASDVGGVGIDLIGIDLIASDVGGVGIDLIASDVGVDVIAINV
jgi:hypothetical protein